MNKFGQLQAEAASAQPPFVARGWRGNAHFQTIWPNRIQRDPAGARLAAHAAPRIIESEDGDRLRVFWSRHGGNTTREGAAEGAAKNKDAAADSDAEASRLRSPTPHPILVVLHGLTGGADADNVMATAAKGYRLGFDVVRADLRNSQADDTPSLGIGHAGRSEDLRAILGHVAEAAPGVPTTVIGFSLGGNIALKGLGEYGAEVPGHLRAAATVSVPIDLDDACRAIDERRSNWIYRTYFLRRLARRYLVARAERPDLFHPIDVDSIRGIRDWDNAVVAPLGGFADADDYYARNSSLNVIGDIRVPTLLIQAQDDPFIPFSPFEASAVRDNAFIELLAPPQGGHVGFFSTVLLDGEPDRYWAENRALAHCAAAVGLRWTGGTDAAHSSTAPGEAPGNHGRGDHGETKTAAVSDNRRPAGIATGAP